MGYYSDFSLYENSCEDPLKGVILVAFHFVCLFFCVYAHMCTHVSISKFISANFANIWFCSEFSFYKSSCEDPLWDTILVAFSDVCVFLSAKFAYI